MRSLAADMEASRLSGSFIALATSAIPTSMACVRSEMGTAGCHKAGLSAQMQDCVHCQCCMFSIVMQA